MTAVTSGSVLYPAPFSLNQGPNFTSQLINAAGEKVAAHVRFPKSGTITHIGIMTGTVTTSQSLDIRIETIGTATGDPTGTLYAASATGTIASPASDTWYDVPINGGTGISVSAFDEAAIVTQFTSTVGDLSIACMRPLSSRTSTVHFWYDAGAGWVKPSDYFGNAAVRYSGGVYHPIVGLTCLTSRPSYYDTTERGVRFRLPFPATLKGLFGTPFRWASDSADFDINIYADATAPGGTPLASYSYEASIRSTSNWYIGQFMNVFEQALAANTWYRLAIEPTGGSNVGWYAGEVNAAAILGQFLGVTDFYLTEDDGAGGWTNTTTRVPFMQLVFNELDDGAGGGGGLAVPPIGGGLID
jgi:hypothetical protein